MVTQLMSAKDNNIRSQLVLILFLIQCVSLCRQNDSVYIKEKVHYYYLVSQIFFILQGVKHLHFKGTKQLAFVIFLNSQNKMLLTSERNAPTTYI